MRLYGRAPRDERLVQKVPHGNWKTITFISALRHNRVTAPFVLEGAMTGEIFRTYVKQFLAPTLKLGTLCSWTMPASIRLFASRSNRGQGRDPLLSAVI
jgi:hypothetical protein